MTTIIDCAYVRAGRTPIEIARRVRELGCFLAPSLRQSYNSRPNDALDAICQYELDARVIEACPMLRLARAVLRDRGYGSDFSSEPRNNA